MKIYVHIGMDQGAASRLQEVMDTKREQLIGKGILYPRSLGAKNHTRLYMAVTDPAHIDPLRYNRGYITAEKQAELRKDVAEGLARDIAQHNPKVMVLSSHQLGSSLAQKSELEQLKSLLAPHSDDITIVAHVGEPAAMLTRFYAEQIFEGRATSLSQEIALAEEKDWWGAALAAAPNIAPQEGQFIETQGAPFWLDYQALQDHWESVFGKKSFRFRALDEAVFYSSDLTSEIRESFDIKETIGKAGETGAPKALAAAWLTRGRLMNDLLLQVLGQKKRILPRQLWRKFINEIKIDGDALDVANFSAISKRFSKDITKLCKVHEMPPELFKAPRAKKAWVEAPPELGFRASQYLLSFMWRINKATQDAAKTMAADMAAINGQPAPVIEQSAPAPRGLSPIAEKIMPPQAKKNYESLMTTSFVPHNNMGRVNEEELAAAYTQVPMRDLPNGNSGNVIVGCMKNEAPYIVEWVAYHRAMGVDNFLIYTNDCSDGTSEILDRLQEMGVLQHRNNDKWKGNSPQQHALNSALKEPVSKNAEWIIHIDVDEFINVRCGNGTLADFFEAAPDATNVAMTWRLFGHNDVIKLSDEFVLEQFDTCAPKFCPKPHTVWGFKTMFKNIGAYEKISCHRPNKLEEGFEDKVLWVNGSGKPMGEDVKQNGWRNSKKSIGYDLLQLNHYALRSAESFLIKRQRGRALHVDRSIGINYWIRMDWSDFKDITIKRNTPRLQIEYDTLMADKELAKWHAKGLKWHRAKADELHAMPEFHDLFEQALKVKLNEAERVAYALALDMES